MRGVPPSIERALYARDGGCTWPGCGRRRFTHDHHIVHWADGGETKLSNLTVLCRLHHRLVHEGGFGCERAANGRLVFRRPDGSVIEAAGTVEMRAGPERLESLDGLFGRKTNAKSRDGRCVGERADCDWPMLFTGAMRDIAAGRKRHN